ncbi:unnamed protein product, partial [Allacma fusca]
KRYYHHQILSTQDKGQPTRRIAKTQVNHQTEILEEENARLKKQVAEMKRETMGDKNDKEYDRKNMRTNNNMISGLDEVNDKSTPEEAKKI